MVDYKATLNLPATTFPMKANLPQKEPETLRYWENLKIYDTLHIARQGSPKFVLHDGPPYANGQIHIGHVLNKVLKDIVIKSKTLSGFDTPFVPGWDCHGLPIELSVEKKLGKTSREVEPARFRQICREYAQSQIDSQRESFKRLGVFADWDHPYYTMDYKYEANIIRSLAKIIQAGYLERGFKPIHWCFDCQSSLAEAEVEYYQKQSIAIDIKFRVVRTEEIVKRFNITTSLLPLKDISFAVWTTTPWTLPANQAIAIHPDFSYALVQINSPINECVIMAEELVSSVMKKWSISSYEILSTCIGQNLENVFVRHPFEKREVSCVLATHVTLDTGTGVVHTAPAHGLEDFQVAKQYHLPIVNPVGPEGCYIVDTPFFAKQHVFKANQNIIDVLEKENNLIYKDKVEHSYPHCWRHKSPVIFRVTSQWFLSLDKHFLRQKAKDAIKNIAWIPNKGMGRLYDMIEKRPDWCISRQNRIWGTPMGLWVHKKTNELHPHIVNLMEKLAQAVEEKGIEAWYELNSFEILGQDADEYEKVFDTLDVWFDAGLSHECVLSKNTELQDPADLYLEGSDQHRGWFQASLLTSMTLKGRAPYRSVLTHGYTVDAEGRKMSKSLGNVISPETIQKTLGVDILRLWVSATDYRSEVSISDEILKRISEAYRRIRNTARYFLSNLFDFDPTKDEVPFAHMIALDQWALLKAKKLQEEIIQEYNNYQFHLIFQKIFHFCSVEMGSFYLDVIKDRQYTCQKNSPARRSCQTAIYHMIHMLVRWLAPILSFTAEEIWQFLPGKKDKSVFLSTWWTELDELRDPIFDLNYWHTLLTIRDEVNKELEKARQKGTIGSSLEAHVTLYCNENFQNLLGTLKKELKFIFITSKVDIQNVMEKPENINNTVLPGLFIQVSLSQFPKCVRCWHRCQEIGTSNHHEELCDRCVENVMGSGELRLFV